MTIANLSYLSTQVVQQETSSIGGGVTSLVTQVVNNTLPARLFISSLQTQIVEKNDPRRKIVAMLKTQVVHQNGPSSGGIFNTSAMFPQVVYTVGLDDIPRNRAWTFDFDGHVFYCLDMGESGCLVYDLGTKSWSKWTTQGFQGQFNFKNGFHWRGGKAVVGGGLIGGQLLELSPDTYIDEEFRPVIYEINGVVFSTSENSLRNYNLRMVASAGRLADDDEFAAPQMKMVYSDDNGATWSTEQTVTLTSDKTQRIEFRSLGSIKQPGRIFRLYDTGGVKFIAYVMADVEGENG